MASETAEASLAASSAPKPTALPTPSAPELFATETGRANSLKRPRGTTPTSPNAAPGGLSHPELSPAKLARLSDSTRFTPAPALTGQAAREDEERRREEEARLHPPGAVTGNPAQQALAALRGAEAMSRATEGPATAQPAADVAAMKGDHPVVVPPPAGAAAENPAGTSPQSATSAQSMGDGLPVVHSPAPMDIDSRNDRTGYLQPDAQMEDKAGSMSYPGIMPPGGSMPAPAQPRGMSLPMSNSQNPDIAPRSPSSKKHKCPYCETEFTRHHNLKSHLLTHSQEKPYVCQNCQMRFRRLHDLKRHSKLHTGEKPHICPKCERRFARGDALARHSKGSGGCAGRRSSMGSFAGDDDYEGGSTEADESAMTGVMYEGNGNDSGTTPTAPPANMVPAPSQPPNIAAAHSRASSGPSAGQSGGSGDSSANLFTSEHGIWAIVQNLEQRVTQQAEKMRRQEERIMELESIKHDHEQQITYLTNDVNALRATIATARAQSQEGQEQPAPKN